MKSIELVQRGKNKGKILLNSVLYTGYTVGNLPNKFAYIYDEEKDNEGYTHWFNRGGLTYIHVPESPFS